MMRRLALFLSILQLFGATPPLALAQRIREDGKCGRGNPAADGADADCDYIAPYATCCQSSGHCGWDCDGRPTVLSKGGPLIPPESGSQAPPVPVAAPAPQQVFFSSGNFRSDGRCGAGFPLESGVPAECDPNSQYWCCSEHGFCGGSHEHCFCEKCINYRPVTVSNGVRSDRRCGPDFPQADGSPSGCNGASANHCCSQHGYCGPGPAHCDCVGCVDYRAEVPKTVPLLSGRVRNDRRCGQQFPLDDGTASECDPNSANYCCSKWGYCGPGADHCDCPECTDYRTSEQKAAADFNGLFRHDRRCGPEFPLPNGAGPSQCDPKSSGRFCCSKWGFCGGDAEHCDCPECINYAEIHNK